MNNDTVKSTLRLISTYVGFFSVKSTGKSHKDSSPVNKADWGVVPQFPIPGNLELVYTCGHLHCHE